LICFRKSTFTFWRESQSEIEDVLSNKRTSDFSAFIIINNSCYCYKLTIRCIRIKFLLAIRAPFKINLSPVYLRILNINRIFGKVKSMAHLPKDSDLEVSHTRTYGSVDKSDPHNDA